MLILAAGVMAAQPFLAFLVLPPPDKADQWIRTLIGLGVMGAASTFLIIQKDPRKRGERAEAPPASRGGGSLS